MTEQFYVGYFDDLHPDPSVNFELNRWINYLGDSALEDFRPILPRLKDFQSYQQEFYALAEKALAEGRKINAAFYFRSAEFYMKESDPDKKPTRQKFLDLVREHYGIKNSQYFSIPYDDGTQKGMLPAYRLTPTKPKGTIVMFGGADSYIEEFLPINLVLKDAGYDVVCFEGPGQGGALIDSKLRLTKDWHKPVKTVLDYFKLNNVTLWGISLGGMLVLRAAAFESRVSQVVCDDISFSSFDAFLSKQKPTGRSITRFLMNIKASGLINAAMKKAMRESMTMDWAISQFSYIIGAKSPYDLIDKVRSLQTGDISHLITQDVLLMAGTEDTMVPLDQFYRQIEALKNVRSLTARMFTRAEHAQNHCQIGNLNLQLDFVINWLDNTKTSIG
ncbi:MAG: alpha/beta fold hydrolase [Dehalococcoidia bacterium]|jgi:pimeloyl-ACP methyl ester carboxylesterase